MNPEEFRKRGGSPVGAGSGCGRLQVHDHSPSDQYRSSQASLRSSEPINSVMCLKLDLPPEGWRAAVQRAASRSTRVLLHELPMAVWADIRQFEGVCIQRDLGPGLSGGEEAFESLVELFPAWLAAIQPCLRLTRCSFQSAGRGLRQRPRSSVEDCFP
ncbi:MAG: hypothetical protein JWQ49_5238, partial [Edaphobacter sp.]|nr:hypothetical protein [Edaphobacter sp.]